MPAMFRFALVIVCLLAATAAANAQTAFYRAPPSAVAGAPGTLIRQEAIDGAPLGAKTYRMLYRSTGIDNKPILVSGIVIVPPGDPPPGGRPIVAWAHPTSGGVPRCAPSLALFLFQQIQGLRSFVRNGYVVAATDYPGLGTEGPHPYLVGVSEARAVIDSVRVAASLPGAGDGKKFVVWGHSQGGHAALFTGIIAKAYAPELELLGVAAAAPATDLVTLMNEDIDTVGGKNITAMTLWSGRASAPSSRWSNIS
jgi:dipeptidyl aminopeptidase/acylaminoacyl peptidase